MLDNSLMHWLGERSYGIYVWHFVVAVEVAALMPASLGVWHLPVSMALVVAVSAALAAASCRV